MSSSTIGEPAGPSFSALGQTSLVFRYCHRRVKVLSDLTMASNSVKHVFEKYLGQSPKPIEALESLLRAGNIPPAEASILTLVRAILNFSQDDLDTCLNLFKHLGQVDSPQSFAELLFPRDVSATKLNQGGISSGALDKIRNDFFEAYPLAVMRALLKQNSDFPLGKEIKELVIYLLEQAVSGGHELRDDQNLMGMYERYGTEGRSDTGTLQENFPEALKVAKTLNALCRLVKDPEDVQLLYQEKYRSAREIAAEQEVAFVYAMTGAGMKRDNAMAAHNAAKRVDCWNEHLWLAMMEERRAEFVPVEPQGSTSVKTKTDVEASQFINNLTDIFDLEDWACETCCSITSLSAYFADLMALLNSTRAKPSSSTTMLEVLSMRRPDLQNLQLTCANSQTLIPYAALVNEVLESYIRYQHEKGKGNDWAMIQPYNMPDERTESISDEHDKTPLEQPANTDPVVNTELIPNQMFPFPTFPYSRARSDIGQIFDGFGVDASKVVETFTCEESFFQRLPDSDDFELYWKVRSCIQEVFARQASAETLGLLQSDFAAITGQTFYPVSFADLVNGMAGENHGFVVESGCRWSTASLWGYDFEEIMLETQSGDGLSFIKSQFLKRSGLEFQELISLTKTRSFCHDLAIANKSGSRVFSTSLDELQLLSGASNPPLKPLTKEICFNLQSFLRLQTKLKWSTQDLDAAIWCLRSRELEINSQAGKPKAPDSLSISPYVLKGIASIVELSKLVDIEPSHLLPLWQNIDTFGPESLMHRKFLSPSMRRVSPIFNPPNNGQYLQVDGSSVVLTDEDEAICIALGWPVEHFSGLLKVAKLQEVGTKLNLDTFSTLHRHVLLCRMLSVEPEKYSQLYDLLTFSGDSLRSSLDNPTSTLAAVKKWRNIFDIGWTFETLGTLTERPGAPYNSTLVSDEALPTLAALIQGTTSLHHMFPYLFTDAPPSATQVVDCASHVFDPPTAKLIVSYIEGV